MANTINSFNSAIDAIQSKQILRVDADGGNLHAVKGAEKIGLAFQKYILKKTPDQLGTSQAAVGNAVANLYKNEKPGTTNAQLGKLLDRLGFTEFAAKLKSEPDLTARQAKPEKGPDFAETKFVDDDKEHLSGVFTRGAGGRAGVASAPAKTPATPAKVEVDELHMRPEDIALAVKSLGIKDSEPAAPKVQTAARLSAAASRGQEINASKQAEPQKQFPFAEPQGHDVASKIKDVENRLSFVAQGKHLNPVSNQARPLKAGEKEQEIKFLNDHLTSLKAQQAKPAEQAKPAKPATGAANLATDLKAIDDRGNPKINSRNFAEALLPHLQQRLGTDVTKQIFENKGSYYLDLGAQARYTDIRPPKDTVVSLSNGNPIHANYVPLGGLGDPAIATQAPKLTNVASFVQLIEEQNITTIIDLTNADDRISKQAPDYSRNSVHGFSSKDITTPELKDAKIEKRELKTANNHAVSYLNLTEWPDHGAVAVDGFKNLLSAIEQEHGNKGGGLTIHCNAGVGRTGTVYAGLELSRLAKNGELNGGNFAEKVLDVVAEGRKARGFAFVQAPEQLNLLFDFAKSLV